MRSLKLLLCIIALVYSIGMQCALNIAGDVTETGNATVLSGVVLDESSVPVSGVQIVVFKLSDDSITPPVAVDTIITDSKGSYSVELNPAYYVLKMVAPSDTMAAMTMPFEMEEGKTKELPPAVLEPSVIYSGVVLCNYGIPTRVLLGGTQH